MISLVLTLSVVPGLDDLPEEDIIEFLCQHPEVSDINTRRSAWERAYEGHPALSLYSNAGP